MENFELPFSASIRLVYDDALNVFMLGNAWSCVSSKVVVKEIERFDCWQMHELKEVANEVNVPCIIETVRW